MIDLHLVTWNRPKMTDLVIRTVERNTHPGGYRLWVFDNGSGPETLAVLRKHHHTGAVHSVFYQDSNKGLEYARQWMLDHCTHNDMFVDMDNDCLPPPINSRGQDWLTRQVMLMDKFPTYAAISQRTQVMIGTGNIFEEADEEKHPIVPFDHPGGSLRLMESEAVQSVGGWLPVTAGRGSEEKKICGRLRFMGYHTAFATDIRCLHLFGTRSEGHETDRWGYDKDSKPEDHGHSDIWHPALGNGDDMNEVTKYAGLKYAQEYFGVDHSDKA